MTAFIRACNPIWFMNNLTGAPLDDTYFAFFLTNDLPYIPQAVFQDPNGVNPWSDPIEFQPSSGLPNNLYFDETLTYRIEIRQGPTQSAQLIYLIQNFVPGTGAIIENDVLLTSENMITNPQFASIFFSSPTTFTTAGTYNIAPGWNLVLTGTGSTTITQGVNAGDAGIEGNPSYYLQVNNSGWTSAQLIQKFTQNGAIFGGGAIAVAFTALATSTPETISVVYSPSTSTSSPDIFNGVISVGAFNTYGGAINLPVSTNSDVDGAAFVNIIFNLPATGNISLSNIQIVGQSVPLSSNFNVNTDVPLYQEETFERMIDHEFNVFANSFINQRKDSIIAGWNFSLNPYHFWPVASTNVPANQYTLDQTIVIQQAYVAGAVGNNIAVGQASLANNQAMQITAVTANNQFGILQYIDPAIIRPYWNQLMSSMFQGFINTVHGTTIKVKARLIYKAALPETVDQTHPVASWAAGSDPIFSAGWTAITPMNDPAYFIANTATPFAFDSFQLPVSTNGDMTLGIFIYTTGNMNQSGTADSIVINDISLVNNQFAYPTQAQTFEEALRRCQYYFEYSWDAFSVIGLATPVGAVTAQVASSTGTISILNTPYKVNKRSNSSVQWYSPNTGTAARIYDATAGADLTVTSVTLNSGNRTGILSTSAPATDGDELQGHYTADSRLGL